MSEASNSAKRDQRGRPGGSKDSAADAALTVAELARELADARARADAAEAKLADHKERLNALGRGREETMLALNEARAELARVKRERDELQRHAAAIDNMQTATMTLTETEQQEEPNAVIHALPSVEELMASLQAFAAAESERDSTPPAAPVGAQQEAEMIAAELVFPEGVDSGPEEPPTMPTGRSRIKNSKVLVFVDADPPIKYPLFNEVTTIGRSETADIRVDGDYISRVHARIVLTADGAIVEDLASTNGIKVNFKPVDRRTLRHGDILSLGKLHFTFIDTETTGAS